VTFYKWLTNFLLNFFCKSNEDIDEAQDTLPPNMAPWHLRKQQKQTVETRNNSPCFFSPEESHTHSQSFPENGS
jgi:hypothetical protein